MFSKIVTAFLALPWTMLVALVRFVIALVALPWRLYLRSASTLPCPAGHRNPVLGRWTCNCGATYMGHVFGGCPVCRMPAGWVKCATCGLAVQSPWKHER